MNNFKYKTLFKAILEQVDLPDNAVIADLGCKNAIFLLAFQEAFPNKIKSAVGVDITDIEPSSVHVGATSIVHAVE